MADAPSLHGHGGAPAAAPAPGSRFGALAGTLDRLLGVMVEVPVALLVALEICILFAGVVARYVFHQPLIWSDELASILFLWLAMLGAAVAFRRGEHMRMAAIASQVNPGTRAFLDMIAITSALAFLLLVFPHALTYAEEESFILTPALEIPNSFRAAALPVGLALMVIFAFLRLAQAAHPRVVAAALIATAGTPCS